MRVTDLGAQDVLNAYFALTGFSLELFVDSGALTDDQATRELATGGGYVEKDLDAVANAVGTEAGVPLIEWEDVVWTFTGALTNAVNKTIKGVMLLRGATIIAEQLLPGTGYTPANNGDKLTISPRFMLGNVPGGGNPA
jgi:hypothetical protein